MKKRLTIKDYQEANSKLVEERATLIVERDDALKLADSTDKAMDDLKVEVLELLGGYPSVSGYGISERKKATKVQIARRAGELVAAERLAERLGKLVFEDEVRIEGAPMPIRIPAHIGVDMGMPGGERTVHAVHDMQKKHVHTIDCLPPQMREGAKGLIDSLTADLTKEVKRRQAKAKRKATFITLVILAACFALGWFIGGLIF